jgi:hypothetical protein
MSPGLALTKGALSSGARSVTALRSRGLSVPLRPRPPSPGEVLDSPGRSVVTAAGLIRPGSRRFRCGLRSPPPLRLDLSKERDQPAPQLLELGIHHVFSLTGPGRRIASSRTPNALTGRPTPMSGPGWPPSTRGVDGGDHVASGEDPHDQRSTQGNVLIEPAPSSPRRRS